jgi:uroporphyrinogen decarboxylase
MQPIERVFNRLQGNAVDFVPYAPLATMYGARLISCPLNEYYSSAEKYVQGQQAVADALEPDILFTPFCFVAEAEAFGSTAVYFDKNPPNLKRPAITDFRGIASLTMPDIENHPRLAFIRESTRQLAKDFKDQIPIAAVCNSPVELPAVIMGIENWIDTILFHPAETAAILELTTRYFIDFANALIADGASCIFTTASFSNPSIVTRRMAEETLIPVLRNGFAGVHGPIMFHHGGARLLPFLDLHRDLPNVVGFVLDPRDSFDEARTILGDGPAVLGNLSGPHLLKRSMNAIEERTLQILTNRKNDPKFIFATSNADIPYDTPIENIRIMRKTIHHFGRS